ncbi:MAG: glycosyltransferase [Patescibacteria group bacterium]|nr:glycosyltransferase [Patescibacteria group bacterium]
MSDIYRGFKNFFSSACPNIYRWIEKYKLIIKYVISGGTAALVDLVCLYVFTDIFGVWYLISACLAFVIAFFVSFSLQKFWTFRDNGREKIYRQMSLYFIVGTINLFLNAIGMYFLVERFNIMYLLAQVMMGALLGLGSFLIYRFMIFKKKKIEAKRGREGNLKILIATGIFPPDIGGPAIYAKILCEELPQLGSEVKIATYGDGEIINCGRQVFKISRKQNIISRYLKYFWRVWKLSGWADIVYAHDLVSVGLPCALVKLFKPKLKLAIRLGGDFLWEKAYNRGWTDKSLSRYYEEPKNFSEKIFLLIYRFVLSRSDKIIFSTRWQKEIYEKYLKVSPNKTVVIDNIFPEFIPPEKPSGDKKRILLAGRLIKLKNFARVFEAVKRLPEINLLVIGEGPEEENLKKLAGRLEIEDRVNFKKRLAWPELAREILGSFLVLAPSITEISPNLVLECLKLGQPVLVTREGGFRDKYKEELIFIDPFSEDDIREKIVYLLDGDNYDNYLKKIKSMDTGRNRADLARDHYNFFKNL